MPARELRLRRTLRRIVALALALPAPCAAACHVAADLEPHDASADGAPHPDGSTGGSPADAGPADAGPADAPSDSCASYSIDGAIYDEPPDACVDFRLLPCGLPPDATMSPTCFPDLPTCGHSCATGFLLYCQLAPGVCDPEAGLIPDAAIVMECISCTQGGGRRPRGLCAHPRAATPGSALGEHFARMAHLEAASVRAFRDLEHRLVALGAPPRLARAAQRAAEDERRHARATGRIARRFGSTPPRPRVRRLPEPSLFELLRDNVVEGCVGETFGALVVTWQGERAADPRVRRTLRAVARDETRHAELSWEILRWGAPRLGPEEQERLAATLDAALASVERLAGFSVPTAVEEVAGYPPVDAARRLGRALSRLVRDGGLSPTCLSARGRAG